MNDSVGKFCTDKRTRRTKPGLEEYERQKKHFESPSLSMRTRILASHASFAPFVPYEWLMSLLSGHAIKISQQSHELRPLQRVVFFWQRCKKRTHTRRDQSAPIGINR